MYHSSNVYAHGYHGKQEVCMHVQLSFPFDRYFSWNFRFDGQVRPTPPWIQIWNPSF